METATLPSAAEIIERLTTVNNDAALSDIYAAIAQFEHRQLTSGGIVLMFAQIVSDYVKGGEIATLVHGLTPSWVDALVENTAIAEEAKTLFRKAREVTSQEEVSLEPPILSQRQASRYLAHWMRQQGYEGPVRILQSYGQRQDKAGTYFDFDVMVPQGVFLVYENGTVEDTYGALSKQK